MTSQIPHFRTSARGRRFSAGRGLPKSRRGRDEEDEVSDEIASYAYFEALKDAVDTAEEKARASGMYGRKMAEVFAELRYRVRNGEIRSKDEMMRFIRYKMSGGQ